MKAVFLSVVLVFVTFPVLSAEPAKDDLVGKWRYTDDNGVYEYTFMEDGTFHGSVARKDQVVWAFSGKWSLEGDTISYEFSHSSLQRIPDGTTDRDKIIEITKDTYVIEARDGKRRTYSRVQE